MEFLDDRDDTGPFKTGDKFGDCIVERLLGKGGLGFVYLVRGPAEPDERKGGWLAQLFRRIADKLS